MTDKPETKIATLQGEFAKKVAREFRPLLVQFDEGSQLARGCAYGATLAAITAFKYCGFTADEIAEIFEEIAADVRSAKKEESP